MSLLYEESLDENMIDKSIRAISQADTLIIGEHLWSFIRQLDL